MQSSICRWVGVWVLLAGCGPKMDADTGGASETETAVTGSTGSTGSNGSTGSTPTTGEVFDCSLSPCMTVIEYDYTDDVMDPCPGLMTPDCGGPELCGELTVKRSEDVEEYALVETQEAALCILAALRDRTKGRVRITWGDPQGFAGDSAESIVADVQILGDETVLMSWDWQKNYCNCYTYARSQRILLQPASFFTACLTEPTTQSLIECFTAGSKVNDPGPVGWLPPWTLGKCDETLPVACP